MSAPVRTTVLIVNFNTSDFIELTLYALRRLTQGTYQVLVLDNGSELKDYERLKRIAKSYPEAKIKRRDTDLRGSMAHATGLEILIAQVNSPYFSILDADATWLRKNWDEILIGKLGDRVKVIGTAAQHHSKAGFPQVYGMLFETQSFRGLGVDFLPDDISAGQDTGWKIRKAFAEKGYDSALIEMQNTREYHSGPFSGLIVAEYYLDGDYQHIFASHFSRGSSLGVEKYRKGWLGLLFKVPVLGPKVLQSLGSAEKKKWLAICRRIVDSQCP